MLSYVTCAAMKVHAGSFLLPMSLAYNFMHALVSDCCKAVSYKACHCVTYLIEYAVSAPSVLCTTIPDLAEHFPT